MLEYWAKSRKLANRVVIVSLNCIVRKKLSVDRKLSVGRKKFVLVSYSRRFPEADRNSYLRCCRTQESSSFRSTVSCSKSCSGRKLKVKYWRVTAIDERRYREFNGDRESCLGKGIQAYVLDRRWKRRIGRYRIVLTELCGAILK